MQLKLEVELMPQPRCAPPSSLLLKVTRSSSLYPGCPSLQCVPDSARSYCIWWAKRARSPKHTHFAYLRTTKAPFFTHSPRRELRALGHLELWLDRELQGLATLYRNQNPMGFASLRRSGHTGCSHSPRDRRRGVTPLGPSCAFLASVRRLWAGLKQDNHEGHGPYVRWWFYWWRVTEMLVHGSTTSQIFKISLLYVDS
ncbi:hypothetical protein BC629DRAFT_644921 [Irpex lacteus]|nr:hypothetical protein BC629DRAFT_644921 [Irpex lacteus]